MPGLDGFEVVEQVGPERMPPSSSSPPTTVTRCAPSRLHAVDYLLKPFDDERFGEMLARAPGS